MAIKLIALDLDFTLLSSDKTISEKNRQALATARAKGVHIVLTTGRPLPAIQHLLEDLDLLGRALTLLPLMGAWCRKIQVGSSARPI